MEVPFVDLKIQYRSLSEKILPALQKAMASSQFVLGKPVEDFEAGFAGLHGMKHCIGVGSGTDALHSILWACGIGAGDEIITVSHTFIATAEAISFTGAVPVFVDIDPITYTMDPERLEQAITKKTKAIIPVHLYGQSAAMGDIMGIANRHGIPVIEDACQAHLAQYDNKYVGHFGIATAFSFYPAKNLGAYGEAGGVTTNDDNIASTIRTLRDHGQTKKYQHSMVGHNYRLDALQAVVLGIKLPHLREWTDNRRKLAGLYSTRLAGVGDIIIPREHERATHVYHLYVIQTKMRDSLREHLASKGIGTGLHYPVPLHLQEAYRHLGYKQGAFPVTETVASQGLSLPMFPELTSAQIDYVTSTIVQFFD